MTLLSDYLRVNMLAAINEILFDTKNWAINHWNVLTGCFRNNHQIGRNASLANAFKIQKDTHMKCEALVGSCVPVCINVTPPTLNMGGGGY